MKSAFLPAATNPVLSNPAMSQFFNRVVVFDRGTLVEDGTHESLATQNGVFKGLLA